MGIFRGPRIVQDGLVLCLDAADSKSYPGSGSTWNDISNTNNWVSNAFSTRNATIYGPTYSSTNKGYFDFDGSNDYIEINNGRTMITSSITFCVWLKQDVVHTNTNFSSQICIVEYPATAILGSSSCFYMALRSGAINFRYQRASYQADASPGVTQTANEWRYYVGTYGDGFISLYSNGNLVGSNALTYSFLGLSATNNNTRIGESGYYNNHFNGKISLCQAYNRVLSASEVSQNYNATKGRFGL